MEICISEKSSPVPSVTQAQGVAKMVYLTRPTRLPGFKIAGKFIRPAPWSMWWNADCGGGHTNTYHHRFHYYAVRGILYPCPVVDEVTYGYRTQRLSYQLLPCTVPVFRLTVQSHHARPRGAPDADELRHHPESVWRLVTVVNSPTGDETPVNVIARIISNPVNTHMLHAHALYAYSHSPGRVCLAPPTAPRLTVDIRRWVSSLLDEARHQLHGNGRYRIGTVYPPLRQRALRVSGYVSAATWYAWVTRHKWQGRDDVTRSVDVRQFRLAHHFVQFSVPVQVHRVYRWSFPVEGIAVVCYSSIPVAVTVTDKLTGAVQTTVASQWFIVSHLAVRGD